MGAVERYAHPKVWSPSGGWWANPPNWQRNTMKLAGMWIVPAMFVFAISVSKEVSALHCRAARGGLDAHVVPLLREKEELSQKKTRRRGGESARDRCCEETAPFSAVNCPIREASTAGPPARCQ